MKLGLLKSRLLPSLVPRLLYWLLHPTQTNKVQFFLVLKLDSTDCPFSLPPSLTHMEVGSAAMWRVTEGKHRAPSQILFEFLVFAYLYVLCTCMSYAACIGCPQGPEKVIRSSGAVTQAAVSFLIWVLGTELGSFGRVASPLNSWRASSGCSYRDPGLIPSTPIASPKCLSPVPGELSIVFWPLKAPGMYVVHITHRQKK